MARQSLLNNWPRLASTRPLRWAMLAEWECPDISIKTPREIPAPGNEPEGGAPFLRFAQGVRFDDVLGTGPRALSDVSFLRISGSRLSAGTALAAICSASSQICRARSTSWRWR